MHIEKSAAMNHTENYHELPEMSLFPLNWELWWNYTIIVSKIN